MTAIVLKLASAGDEQPNPDAPTVTFDSFYARYPRKVARKVALASWSRVAPSEYPKIMEALERHKKSDDWRKQGGIFIPYPATWLNQERWTDAEEIEIDLSMGLCQWNVHGTREPGKPRCEQRASKEKGGIAYCAGHASRVN